MPLFESNDQMGAIQRDRADLLLIGGFPGLLVVAAIAVFVSPYALLAPAAWAMIVIVICAWRGVRLSSLSDIRERLTQKEFSTSLLHGAVAPVFILGAPIGAQLLGSMGIVIQSMGPSLGFAVLTSSAWRIVNPASCKCGYELEGLPTDLCPECGRRVDRLAAWTARLEEHATCVGSSEELRESLTPWLKASGIVWDRDAGCFVGEVVDRRIALDVENRPSGAPDSVFDRIVTERFETLAAALPEDAPSPAMILLIPGRLADTVQEHDPAETAREQHPGSRVIVVTVLGWEAR